MATDSDDSNYHPWKRTAWESRQAVSEALVSLPAGYSPHQAVGVSEYHELAQTYLFEYFSVFEPKKSEFGGDLTPDEADDEELRESLWWEPLTTVSLPVDGRVRLNGDADVLENGSGSEQIISHVAGRVPSQPVTLRLGTIRRLFQSDNTFELTVMGWVENQGPVERTVTQTRYLPVTGILGVRSQLDECLEEAGWLPDIQTTPRTEITEELVREVEEWRQKALG